MLFVAVRRNLNRIAGDVGLLVRVARRLRAEGRWEGRTNLPGMLGRLFVVARASVAGHIVFRGRQ